ncbi:MAG: cysteine--tRNA ligase [Vicinamibacteria bacterium]|nr:cysteine--tRNA ligase [Vicinamibacteria bacterium]
MRLYNTLSRQEEPFVPSMDDTVRMYTCGLTVYNRGHIGNFRTFVCLDVLRRTLRHICHWRVHQVMNFTDVDDRTILGAQKVGQDLRTYTTQYVEAFREDAAALGLEPVEDTPRATDEANLEAMANLVHALERNGHTYRSDGSIYFRIASFPAYGKLARLDHEGIKPGARVDSDNYAKDDARDFVLWKATKPGEPTWDYGLGPGRPGWHLECSAMALRLLGHPPIDLHAGGIDLIFPHHENEIAQSEGATGTPFSRFWVHVEHLIIDNEKMSKSLGNVYNVKDVVDQGFRPSALRYLLLSSHYRKQLRFSWDTLQQADESLRRLVDALARLDTVTGEQAHPAITEALARGRVEFDEVLQADLNTSAGLAVLFDLVRVLNSAIDDGAMGEPDARAARELFGHFDRVLGVLSLRQQEDARPPVDPAEIDHLIEERQAARRRRDFAAGDRIRDELASRGIILEDGPGGTRWKRK